MSLPQPRTRRITVMQGQVEIDDDPDVVLTTVLGSCVACCMFDPTMQIGGMNHFLLSEPSGGGGTAAIDENYGVYLMEVLVNGMLSRGVRKQNIRAHLYGGGNLHAGMQRIGAANALFAKKFLLQENIPTVRTDLCGNNARRVDFMPAAGKVRCRSVHDSFAETPQAPIRKPAVFGDVELF